MPLPGSPEGARRSPVRNSSDFRSGSKPEVTVLEWQVRSTLGSGHARERLLLAAGSTGQRNTLIFYQGWSVDMKQRRRIYYSAAQRSEIWDRWQAGEPRARSGAGLT